LMSAKDYLFGRLTGTVVTDPSTASGYGCYDLQTGWWLDTVREAARELSGVNLDLPPVLASTHLAPLQEAAAAALGVPAGVPVCLGAADSVMGAIGMGVTASGDIAYVGGTSTVILGVLDYLPRDVQHRFLITPMVEPETWGLEMDLLTTGAAFRWLASMLGMSDERALLELAATSRAVDLPVFLPYLAPGEQGALWDPALTGTISGLHLATNGADIARALVDGIVLESRRCMSVLAEFGFDGGPVRVSGGSASDAWFRQQLADATGRSVVTSAGSETDRSAAGAAAVGAGAIGWQLSSLVPARESSVPAAEQSQRWAHASERHDSALSAIRNLP